MLILPWYHASEVIKKSYLRQTDQLFAIQVVDPTFDRKFNDDIFKLIADGQKRESRSMYVEGVELGDPVNRYYLQIC